MDVEGIKETLHQFYMRYRFFMLILLLGIVLMLMPSGSKETKAPTLPAASAPAEQDLQTQLTALLSSLSGAGKVQVLLSVASGEEIFYQCNENSSSSDSSSSMNSQTVVITDSGRNQKGVVRQINPPVYQGAVILCQGADDPKVRLSIVQAVSSAAGLPTHRISVLKMK